MATYTVQAPDGKTITLEGPEGASQADVIAQAQALYQPKAAPAPKPAAPKSIISRDQRRVGVGVEQAKVRQIYENARNSVISKIADPVKREAALRAFDTDPRAQAMRKNAGLTPVSTRQGEVRQIAKQAAKPKERGSDYLASLFAGAERASFGIPERIKAAIHQYLPESKLELQERGGKPIPKGKNYQDQLALERAENEEQRSRSLAGNVTGQVLGAVTSGSLAGRAVMGVARAGARAAVPGSNILQTLGTLNKGERLTNAAKIAGMGAAGGGAQSAGEGSDVVEGVVTGAIAAPLVVGGIKAGNIVLRPFRDILQMTSANRFIRRLTSATQEQLERRAAQYRTDTGAEPTLFELLPLADRNKLIQTGVAGKDNVVEAASEAIRNRARNLGPEMSRRANEVLAPQRGVIERGMGEDLTRARQGNPDPTDPALVQRAARSPTDMLALRREEARAIMAPHENTPVVDNLTDLYPSAPAPGGGARLEVDPEVSAAIRAAAGGLARRQNGVGINAGEVTNIIANLGDHLDEGLIAGGTAQRAIDHLREVIAERAPGAAAAAEQMTEAFAARSRMMEGMKEGSQTRLRDDIQVGTSGREARRVTNAYDTTEGTAGRSLGQANKIQSDLGGSPEEALRATIAMSRNSTGRALQQNIGDDPAARIMAAARAQDESAQAFAAASNKAQAGGDSADGEMLVQAIAGLHPGSFATTKAWSLRKLVDRTYIPENRARVMVDMLFSQNPTLMRRALNAVGNEPNGAEFVRGLAALVGNQSAGAGMPGLPGEGEGEDHSVEAMLAGIEEDPAAVEDTETPVVEGDSPYVEDLQQIYDTEDPALLDLIDRVKQQESGGNHFQADGSVTTSSAGAIGIMQVMPQTAPEAAELAGLPWDEDAYRNDPVYNELLGIAYLSEQLRKYDGDVDMALAAYNAGPGAVDDALASGGDWLSQMPAETQDYVTRIG